jgi:hypothetical protein
VQALRLRCRKGLEKAGQLDVWHLMQVPMQPEALDLLRAVFHLAKANLTPDEEARRMELEEKIANVSCFLSMVTLPHLKSASQFGSAHHTLRVQ